MQDELSPPFTNRREAGQHLAAALSSAGISRGGFVLALPRGGVPVAVEVARRLHAPLDVLVVRKIGVPDQEELACGAVASGGVVVWNDDILNSLGIDKAGLEEAVRRENAEVLRREVAIRGEHAPQPEWSGELVILVDDGLATGASMRAAVEVVKRGAPREIVVAVPVAPSDTCDELRALGCLVVCPRVVSSGSFGSVGSWYNDFTQVTTEECRQLLQAYRGAAELHAYGG